MNRTTKVVFCAGAAVLGWHALRYFHRRLSAASDLALERHSVRDAEVYRRATDRWENEGGATAGGHVSGSPHSVR